MLGISRLGSFAWDLSLGDAAWDLSVVTFRLESVAWDLSPNSFHLGILLGSFDWDRPLSIFPWNFVAWNLSLRNFRLGTFAWDLSLGIFGWGSAESIDCAEFRRKSSQDTFKNLRFVIWGCLESSLTHRIRQSCPLWHQLVPK